MNREIPGYYYDADRRKYFKIEASRTAPGDAAWSAGNVKRRKTEQKEKEVERQMAERRKQTMVKRARALEDPLVGGLVRRETLGREAIGDTGVKAWADGLKGKGGIRLWPDLRGDRGMVSTMWIGGDERSGLGVAYAALDDEALRSSYIPRDDDDEINFRDAAARFPRTSFVPTREPCFPQVSGLSYHQPSNRMFMTSRQPTLYPGVGYLSPRTSEDGSETGWLLGDLGVSHYGASEYPNRECVINTCLAAPASSRLACVAGTNMGILKWTWTDADRLDWLTGGKSSHHPKGSAAAASQGEIFALDFLPLNPAEIILCGGRSSTMVILDLRAPESEWVSLRHASSIAHLKALGEYEVLAAGPRSAMAIYDIRSVRRGQAPGDPQMVGGNEAKPVVKFWEYKNEAHISIGLDVLVDPGLGGGIVAAAHDDGRVGLFSLKDGTRLRSAAVNGINVGGGFDPGGRGRVVKCLRFATLPGDGQASLFVGKGMWVNKYSFGRGEGDEW